MRAGRGRGRRHHRAHDVSVTVMGEVAAVKLVLVKAMGATARRPHHRVVEEYVYHVEVV